MESVMDLDVRIKDEILTGRLKPGEKINISGLKKRYDVGLTPLRETLARLVSTGLVTCEQNKGFSISPVSVEELIDLYDLTLHLELLALKQSIERSDDKWEEEIVSSIHHLNKIELNKKKLNYNEWSLANARFHDALIANCSKTLKELRAFLHLKAERYVRISFGLVMDNFEFYNDEHQKIAKATLAKDKNKASKLLKEHIEGGRDILLEKFQESRTCI